MIKVYVMIVILGILAGVGYSAKYYYDTTQNTIATLRENNVQLELAVQVAQESVTALQENMAKVTELNKTLQEDLQKAEAYSDELRSKLSNINLVVEALKDSKKLEGKMNGATANLWRDIMSETGNTNEYSPPVWLQQSSAGTTDQDSDQDRESSDTSSSETQTTTTE